MKLDKSIKRTIGFVLLVISCFISSVAATWWLGGIAVVMLIAGSVCQYNSARTRSRNGY